MKSLQLHGNSQIVKSCNFLCVQLPLFLIFSFFLSPFIDLQIHVYSQNSKCKVEFNQPFCWLYSVLNLLVIQHLETLYLGENHVRVVCERV